MSIQSAFNNALYSVSRVASYGEEKDKTPAEKTLTPYQQASLEIKKQKLGLDKEKLAQNKAKEERLQEELQVKQSRTPGIVAQRKATADVLEAQAGIAKAQAGPRASARPELRPESTFHPTSILHNSTQWNKITKTSPTCPSST